MDVLELLSKHKNNAFLRGMSFFSGRAEAKEFLWVVFGQFGAFAGTALALFVASRAMSVSEYGRFGLFSAIISVVSLMIFGPLLASFTRFGSTLNQKAAQERVSFVKTIRLISLLVAAVVLFVALMAAAFVPNAWCRPSDVVWIGSIASCSFLYALLHTLANSERIRWAVALGQIFEPCLRVVAFGAVFFNSAQPRAETMLAAWAVAGVVSLSFLLLLVKLKIERSALVAMLLNSFSLREVRGFDVKSIFLYALPFMLWGIALWSSSGGDRWLLASFGSVAVVGQYALANQLMGPPLAVFSGAVQGFLTPILFQAEALAPSEKYAAMRSLLRAVVAIIFLGFCFVGIIVILWPLVFEVFPASYRSSRVLVLFLGMSALFVQAADIVAIKVLASWGSWRFFPFKMFNGVGNFVFAYSFGKVWGAIGIAAGLSLGSFLYFGSVLGFVLLDFKNRSHWREEVSCERS